MSDYITAINQALSETLADLPDFVLFGENINNGSFISGLTRGLKVQGRGQIINVGNCEATQCGVGFGLMINGVSSVLFSKQLDFMLLGMDQFVNTYNFIRASGALTNYGSFTICTIVCDQGMQGPQSSFNGLGDICSLANVPGHCLTSTSAASSVLRCVLKKPGFRFVCLSQRMFSSPEIESQPLHADVQNGVFKYFHGEDVGIVCFNFALPSGLSLKKALTERGIRASLFSLDYCPCGDWREVLSEISSKRGVIIIDDCKGTFKASYKFSYELSQKAPRIPVIQVERSSIIDFGVCADQMEINISQVVQNVLRRFCFSTAILPSSHESESN